MIRSALEGSLEVAHASQLSRIARFNYRAGQMTIKVPRARTEYRVSNTQVTIGLAEHSHAIAAARNICMHNSHVL